MPNAPIPPLAPWHDYYLVLGAAAATLIGAMFVVASIGSGVLTRETTTQTSVFLTPIVTHLATVLLTCAAAVVPSLSLEVFGAVLAVAGLAGMLYCTRIAWLIVHWREYDRSDFVWYGVVPLVAYAAMAAAGLIHLRGGAESLDLLAAALALFIVAGLRNAWDLILFIVRRSKSQK